MACNFSIPFNGNAETIMNKAKNAVESQGGNFNGNTTSGSFDVSVFGNSIAGSYVVSGQNLEVTITDKPFMVPCSAIESFLSKQIS